MDINLSAEPLVCSENRAHRLCAARSDQTEESEDFAFMELEGHMVVSLACEIFDFEDDFILLSAGFLSRCDGCDRAADHGVDQFVAVGLAYIECADIFAVTHDRSPVADLENFFKSVADIHDRDAIFFQFLNYFEKCFGLFLGEGSGRLVKRDDGRLVIQSSGDGQHLHLSGCESSGNVLSFEVAVEIFQYLIDVRIHFSVVNKSALQRFIAESDVLADGQKQNFTIQLIGTDGTILASSKLKTQGTDWQQYTCVLSTKKSCTKARLAIIPQKSVRVGLDMISLFPQETFMNRPNGLRRDLAQVIADLKPKFVRFPGGCMSHGQGLDNIYHWNHTVGPLQDRKPDFNIWGYHQTRGLGFFEYFQFCEDIGAEPLPVLAAGVPCQNSAANAQGIGGQQCGIPMDQMPAYIQELLDLIEWANGDPATSKWAKLRADAGHPAPFNLKYIGIGNEDIIGTVFEERYEMICKAIRQKYPEIKICGTVGPFHAPSADYVEGWDFTKRHPELQYMVDEHYYESTGWFMHHRNYYDGYDRTMPKVYLGEYAASTNVKRPNIETALAEALYLTDVERNGDVVEMTSYAPMLAKDKHHNWDPDMIYFSNTEVRPTPAYHVQRMFSVYGGDKYVSTDIQIAPELKHRVGVSLVRHSATGRRYLKLVNALPVELTIKANGLTIPADSKTEEFSGQPTDQTLEMKQGVAGPNALTLPPYTFRVIEL